MKTCQAFTILSEHNVAAMTLKNIFANITLDAVVAFLLPFVATTSPVIWHEEDFWNVCVLQRVDLSNFVIQFLARFNLV
jgi:hypothetical protein